MRLKHGVKILLSVPAFCLVPCYVAATHRA